MQVRYESEAIKQKLQKYNISENELIDIIANNKSTNISEILDEKAKEDAINLAKSMTPETGYSIMFASHLMFRRDNLIFKIEYTIESEKNEIYLLDVIKYLDTNNIEMTEQNGKHLIYL